MRNGVEGLCPDPPLADAHAHLEAVLAGLPASLCIPHTYLIRAPVFSRKRLFTPQELAVRNVFREMCFFFHF